MLMILRLTMPTPQIVLWMVCFHLIVDCVRYGAIAVFKYVSAIQTYTKGRIIWYLAFGWARILFVLASRIPNNNNSYVHYIGTSPFKNHIGCIFVFQLCFCLPTVNTSYNHCCGPPSPPSINCFAPYTIPA